MSEILYRVKPLVWTEFSGEHSADGLCSSFTVRNGEWEYATDEGLIILCGACESDELAKERCQAYWEEALGRHLESVQQRIVVTGS